MRRGTGVALVAALLTGTALLAAASLAALLAAWNLQAAAYERRALLARAEARAGVELAEARLDAELAAGGTVPATPPPLRPPAGWDLAWHAYRPRADGTVELEVRARTEGARAVAGGVWAGAAP